jgi:chaperonin GroES
MKMFDGFCSRCTDDTDLSTSAIVEGVASPEGGCPNCGGVLAWRQRWRPEPGRPYALEALQPLDDRLLVLPLAEASQTIGGIILAENSAQRERPQHGLVLAAGTGRRNVDGTVRAMQVRVGDVIFFGKYSGQEFAIDNRRVLNMAEIEVYSRLAAGSFEIVEHESAKDWHLKGSPCDLCLAPEEKAASERLRAAREQLVSKVDDVDALEAERRRASVGQL